MNETVTDSITITINGKEIQTRPGQMLIDVADDNNISIPRFCYHKKLSVAANCRMCLVEVEKAPKPMPACATQVNDGMVIKTKSTNVVAAQKSVMEFLLINHPLDCPVCDQGGECELQDVAMGFGGDVSQYTESKRVVCDKNIGPLIATDLTRCILCTRCVRFGEEIAGLPELGATGRGESTQIGTYIEKSVTSELSGNIIDLCPVGALTAKPSRFTSRPWELIQHATVAAHDCVGSNLYVHTRNQQVMRVVPRDNEQINEAWISDRDRFSYTSVNSDNRLLTPKVRENGKLKDIDWESAINLAVEKLQAAANQKGDLAGLISPQCTLEEHYLFQKLVRGLGSNNIDHRLKQVDFSAQNDVPAMPWLGRSIESLESLDSALLVAGDLRTEQPILNHRIRKAVINNNAAVASISSVSGQYNYDCVEDIAGSAEQILYDLASVVVAVANKTKTDLPAELTGIVEKVTAKKEHNAIAAALIKGEQSAVIVGVQAISHPQYALVMQLVEAIASMSQSSLGYLSDSANTAGACLAGSLPNRVAAGINAEESGQNSAEILSANHKVLMLMGIDPMIDISNGSSVKAAADNNDFIIAINSFENEFANEAADLILPLATFLESSGTFVNVEGFWQPFKGCAAAAGESRQGWKILTALSQVLLPADNNDYADSVAVRNELKQQCRELKLDNFVAIKAIKNKLPTRPRALQKISGMPIYAVDAMVRNSDSLQATVNMKNASCVRVNSAQAEKSGLTGAEQVHIKQGEGTAILPMAIDENIPAGCVWIPSGLKQVEQLTTLFGSVEVEKVS
ncbi:MAG: NADH-quinone oxidoreductase subunit G [Gammaproteobacteria bacterium]|nr:NADH-quinone oxidoreductase subunit G [Gammaproteobacteria bacterium]